MWLDSLALQTDFAIKLLRLPRPLTSPFPPLPLPTYFARSLTAVTDSLASTIATKVVESSESAVVWNSWDHSIFSKWVCNFIQTPSLTADTSASLLDSLSFSLYFSFFSFALATFSSPTTSVSVKGNINVCDTTAAAPFTHYQYFTAVEKSVLLLCFRLPPPPLPCCVVYSWWWWRRCDCCHWCWWCCSHNIQIIYLAPSMSSQQERNIHSASYLLL